MNYLSKKINYFIQLNLKLIIILGALFHYKYLYDAFRFNQEIVLRLFIIIAITLWIIKNIITERMIWKPTKINILFILLILVMSISLLRINSIYEGIKDLTNFISYFLIVFLIVNTISKEDEFHSFLKVIFITSLILSFYTIIQYYGLDPYLKELNSLTSTLGQKNWISNYISTIFFIFFILYILESCIKKKITYFVFLLILYTTIIICQSRGIFISIAISLIIGTFLLIKFKLLIFFKKNKRWFFLILIAFFIITMFYSTNNYLNRSSIKFTERTISTFDKEDVSINKRILMWKCTLNMIKDKPLIGLGISGFRANYFDYQADFLKNNPNYIKYWSKAAEVHNEYLQLFAELGIIGLILFLSIFFTVSILVINFCEKTIEKSKKLILLGLYTGVNCFLFHCLFSFPLHVTALGSLFFIIIGLIVAYINICNKDLKSNNRILEFKLFKGNKISQINFKKLFVISLLVISSAFLINKTIIKSYRSEIYYFNAISSSDEKKDLDSLKWLQKSLKLSPNNGRIIFALGANYYNLNKIDEAIYYLKKAEKFIKEINSYYILGLCYFKLNMFEKAKEEFKQAIYLDPKFDKAHYNLGNIYFIQEKYDDTIEQWNKILEIEPNFPNKYIVLNNLGIVYQKKEMPDKALEYFLQALQLAPEAQE
jgi:O-antigen ligase/Tfp pilus assembly protein PilF